MKLSLRLVLMVLVCLWFSACAFTPQNAVIKPEVNLAKTNEGHGTTVVVKIVDERADKTLGHRGGAAFKGAKITTTQNIEGLIREEIMKGLVKKGFNPKNCNPGGKPDLKVEIRLIEYSTSTGFWTGGIHTKAALKAIARTSGKSYEKIYRVANEERVFFVPTAEANEKYLNQLISDVLNKLFQDQKLIATIAKL